MEPVISLASTFLALADRDYKTQGKYEAGGYLDDPRAIEIARILSEDLGVKHVELLGSGSFGVAAAISKNEVVKLTVDGTEVESGTVLANTSADKYPRNVVRVQGAWYVRKLRVFAESWYHPETDEWHYAKKRIGILRMERVNPLDDGDDDSAVAGLSEYVRFVKTENKLWAYQTRKISHAKARERFLKAGNQLEHLLMSVWAARQEPIARDVAHAIAQLRAVGIYGIDFHGGNVGWVTSHEAPRAAESTTDGRGYSEEDLVYRDVRFKVYGSERVGYRVFIRDPGFGPGAGPMTHKEAMAWAHGEIDRTLANRPPVTAVDDRLYKVFDIGMSSLAPGAPKPGEIPAKRVDSEAYSAAIHAGPVKVAEIG